jgi:hypothetical protein
MGDRRHASSGSVRTYAAHHISIILRTIYIEEGRTAFLDGHNIRDPKYADALGHRR